MAKDKRAQELSTVKASPTKRFFVEMLTRDIELDDALLDLLDNCVDGVMRETQSEPHSELPYAGYHADIKFSPQEFRITDNCGGIDRDTAEKYAFLMGRRADDPRDRDLPTVGMYGIGMKRAIFKLGREASVTSKHRRGSFEVTIPNAWFAEDNDEWELKAQGILQLDKNYGTTIVVKRLQPSVKDKFAKGSDFEADFIGKLRSHYAYIMHKGFEVKVNGQKVEPQPIKFMVTTRKKKKEMLAPYMYDSVVDDVKVQVTVGFYRPLATEEEADREMEAKRSRENAGWSIICNDRVVVYCDKTRITGWGEADVPNFHAQFNAISGVVTFSSSDPLKLPLTTTKRGIDLGSDLYLRVKNRMREGTKLFTNYTYKWKHALDEAKAIEREAASIELGDLRKSVPESDWHQTRKGDENGRRFMPSLPTPDVASDLALIRFQRPKSDVRLLADDLLDDPEAKPNDVGAAAFDKALKAIKK
ncbi:ATP-binding protein [Polyangium sorediatum]|uniref:ATP-binding protein n=1 Tax=Polyangium sorediatum TaxID=889274 RepID=A0ABT6NTI1_9BACT|nr:ATP-binding protein [Polyangium sorediatum]MDI1431651.1 ATP-binding protein [Polyangium sorediatum]